MHSKSSLKKAQELIEEYDWYREGLQNTEAIMAYSETNIEIFPEDESRKAFLREREVSDAYQRSKLRCAILESCFEHLSDQERRVIDVYHRMRLKRTDAIALLCNELYCSESTVKRFYLKTMHKLIIMLGGLVN